MALRSWITHVAARPENKFIVTKNPLTASFVFPAFSAFSLDKNGIVDATDIMWVSDSALLFAQHYPYSGNEERWINWLEVRRNHLTFISSLEVKMSRKLYDRRIPKWDLKAEVGLGFIGKSTVTFLVKLYYPGLQEVLIEYTAQTNGINKVTRKSSPFPEWFRTKYEDQCSLKSGLRINPFPRPKATYVYKHEVTWLETDLNAHTNFTSYIQYAIDGIHRALKHGHNDDSTESLSGTQDAKPMPKLSTIISSSTGQTTRSSSYKDSLTRSNASPELADSGKERKPSRGALKGMSESIIKQGLKLMRVCYVQECFEGDLVDVHLWQEEGEEFTCRCSIEKGEQLICQIFLEYFSPLAVL